MPENCYEETLLQLYALLTGAISFNDPRITLDDRWTLTLLDNMNMGSDAFDRKVGRHLLSHLDTVPSDLTFGLWDALDCYRRRTGDTQFSPELAKLEAGFREKLNALAVDAPDFFGTCYSVLRWVPELRKMGEALLLEHRERLDLDDICELSVAYEEIGAMPQLFIETARERLDNDPELEMWQLEELANDYPLMRPLALDLYSKRAAQADILELLFFDAIEDEDFAQAWYAEIFKPQRKNEIAWVLEEKGFSFPPTTPTVQ